MAALSYALDQVPSAAEDAPLNIRVGSGRRPGPLERRRQDPEIASPDAMSLEFEKGRPLKNFGRLIANSAGIPLPYNFRQNAEAAEQARIDYENQNTQFGDMADTFLANLEDNATSASTESMRRQYTQYAAQGRDAIAGFFAQDASPQQRAASYAQLVKLDDEARHLSSAESQDDAQQKRKVQLEQYVRSSNELLDVRSAVAQTGRSVENYNRGREALRALDYDAPELQQFMRNAAADILGAAGQGAKLGLGTITPSLAVLDSFLSSEGRLLDPEVMDTLINTIGRSNIEHGDALLKGLSDSNQRIVDETPGLRDLPAFGTVPFRFETPATDAYWKAHGNDGPVARDIIDTSVIKNTALGGLGATGEALGGAYNAVRDVVTPDAVQMTDDAKRRAEAAGILPPGSAPPLPPGAIPSRRPVR